MTLRFGLRHAIPEGVATAWGARWIYPDDMLPDRQDMTGPDTEQLKTWLNAGPLKAARLRARQLHDQGVINQTTKDNAVLLYDERGIIIANPNASYGYLYVAAWLHTEAK